MYNICLSANNVSFILVPAINKEIVKAKVSFLALDSCLYSGPSFDNYST